MKIEHVETIDGNRVICLSQIYTNTKIYQSTANDTIYYVCVNDIVVAKLVSNSKMSVFAMNYYEEN